MNKQGVSVAGIVMLVVIFFYLAKAVASAGNQFAVCGWVPERSSVGVSLTVAG